MQKPPDQISEREAERRRDRILRVMLSTPPKPRKSMTPKRPEAQRKKTKAAKRGS
jgi:hypothetical protein